MKSGPFLLCVAAVYGIEPKTVGLFGRELKEAGEMTTGKGGRGAPEMTGDDLAAITTSLLGTDRPAQAVSAFRWFGGMQLVVPRDERFFRTAALGPDHTFLDFMRYICSPEREPPKNLTIKFERGTRIALVDLESSRPDILYENRSAFEAFQDAHSRSTDDDVRPLHEFWKAYPQYMQGGIHRGAEMDTAVLRMIKRKVFFAGNAEEPNPVENP